MRSRCVARTIFTNLIQGSRMGCRYLLANSAQFLEASLFLPFTGLFLEGKDVTKP